MPSDDEGPRRVHALVLAGGSGDRFGAEFAARSLAATSHLVSRSNLSETFGTLFALLAVYRSGLIKVTENFRLGVAAATGAIFVVYLAQFVLGLIGVQVGFLHEAIFGAGLLGIGVSVVVIIVAALNLVLDFDFIEKASAAGAPRPVALRNASLRVQQL